MLASWQEWINEIKKNSWSGEHTWIKIFKSALFYQKLHFWDYKHNVTRVSDSKNLGLALGRTVANTRMVRKFTVEKWNPVGLPKNWKKKRSISVARLKTHLVPLLHCGRYSHSCPPLFSTRPKWGCLGQVSVRNTRDVIYSIEFDSTYLSRWVLDISGVYFSSHFLEFRLISK